MLKLSAWLLVGWCIAAPAQAGLFADDDARKRIQILETRLLKIEESLNQQTRSMLDLQGQIESLNAEIRKLRGQNEELLHGLQDAEKRSKDFYVDLDTRLRHFESAEEAARVAAENAAKEAAAKPVAVPANANPPAATIPVDPSDPTAENRAFESAYALFKSGSHANAVKAFQEFIGKYPDSVHVSNAKFWLGNALQKTMNYKSALNVYQELLKSTPESPRAADTMFNIAECQRELKLAVAAKKTLKQLVATHPDSIAAAKARKLLSSKK
ncbi:MAG: tol-pal system protein YbgF [Gallionella sp.]